MNLKEAIEQRKSRRTFSSQKLEKEVIESIQIEIDGVNQKSGLTFSFIEDGSKSFNGFKSYGMFKNVRSLIVLKGNPNQPHFYEKIGYFGEQLMLELVRKHLGVCWVGGTYQKNEEWKDTDEEIVCVFPVGYTKDKLDFKEKIIQKQLHMKRKTLEQLCTYDKAKTWFIEAMKAVQKAPSAVNRQPFYFTLKNDVVSVKMTQENKPAEIDLGIAKYHFEVISQRVFPWGSPALVKGEEK